MDRRSDYSSAATAGDRSAPDIGGLTIDSGKDSRQSSPPSGRKRPAEHEFTSPRGKGPSHVEVVDSEYSRQIPHTVVSDRTRPKPQDARLFDPKQSTKVNSNHHNISLLLGRTKDLYLNPSKLNVNQVSSNSSVMTLDIRMMALLYETVPAFEDTWIECLGDLGRYRMAIEDEDVRDRETWAGVARSWYTKAADKNPTVGRLYHHLAILARPNALQQIYYYSRSLTCVKPFQSARESILTLLDPILGRSGTTLTHALAIDTNFIKAHGLQFDVTSAELNKNKNEEAYTVGFLNAKAEFIENLDNHIGRVTAKWKEQGVYIAVTNIAGWFEYGMNENFLRQAFLTQIYKQAQESLQSADEDKIRTASPADQQNPTQPSISEQELHKGLAELPNDATFMNAKLITNETFALVLRRIGDKNVLPHVHIMLAFLDSFASSIYVSDLLANTPWAELVAFLNTLVKTENQIQTQSNNQTQNIDMVLTSNMFPGEGEREDELPLPEDYLVRGLIWAHDYFPKNWFRREHDEEERYLELASTVKNRMERVLRLGFRLSKRNKWISYDKSAHTFSVLGLPE
ncbi:unnamed protein product [Alternaria alternata]